MKSYGIERPIGLAAPCAEIEANCGKADMYKRCGLRPSHLIIPLDPGSGRTTLIEYMADMYKKAGVLNFTSGLDDYVEIVFNGELPQLKRGFAAINSAAIYANRYAELVGMDISGVADRCGETQFSELLKESKRICAHACVVFFVHSTPTRNEERLLEKLCETIDNVKRLDVEPYTREDMCALIIKTIADHGVEIKHEELFRETLADMVAEFGVSGVKDAIAMGEALVRLADFSGFTPTVDEDSLKSMIADRHNNAGRSEVK